MFCEANNSILKAHRHKCFMRRQRCQMHERLEQHPLEQFEDLIYLLKLKGTRKGTEKVSRSGKSGKSSWKVNASTIPTG